MYLVLLFYWVLASILFLLIASGLLAWLWNITMPELFGVKTVRYGQAMRLLLIAALLFGPGTFLKIVAP